MLALGWRWMFILMGAAGLVMPVVWYAGFREVDEAGLTAGEDRCLPKRDRRFESGSLQLGVCELSVPKPPSHLCRLSKPLDSLQVRSAATIFRGDGNSLSCGMHRL
jgi:hypothetical protein